MSTELGTFKWDILNQDGLINLEIKKKEEIKHSFRYPPLSF